MFIVCEWRYDRHELSTAVRVSINHPSTPHMPSRCYASAHLAYLPNLQLPLMCRRPGARPRVGGGGGFDTEPFTALVKTEK